VDDVDMAITHVLRAMTTSPIAQTTRAVPRSRPGAVFGHVPMINGRTARSSRSATRHAVGDYQHMGILPAAMRNFLALLGWSPAATARS